MSNNTLLRHEILSHTQGKFTTFLATVEGDQPKVRVVELVSFNDSFYLATGSDNAKVEQIKMNPKTEFCLLIEKEGKSGSLRVECKAKIIESVDLKNVMYKQVEEWWEFYDSTKDPRFTLIELKPTFFIYNKPGTLIIEYLDA
jgi:uncharacterized pyridoxamine 5'-phosphate oxidase family protein